MKRVVLLVAGSLRGGHRADLEGHTDYWSLSKQLHPAVPKGHMVVNSGPSRSSPQPQTESWIEESPFTPLSIS